MLRLVNLIKREFITQASSNNLIKYSFVFFIFYPLTLSLISSPEEVGHFGLICRLISLPLCLLTFSANILQPDIEDGSLELLLITYPTSYIVIAKFFFSSLSTLLGFLLTSPIMYLIFNLNINSLLINCLISFFLITISASLSCLIAAVQGYFKSYSNILTLIIMPLIIPSVILAGISTQSSDHLGVIYLMLGINLSLIPVFLYFTKYLIDNIYNI